MGDGVTRLIQGGVTSAQGFVASGVHCGIKPQGKDLALVVSRVPAAAAGVFTTNKVKAAPVLLDMERIRSGQGRAVLLSSGNANACTGEQGLRDAREMAHLVAEHLQVPEDLVYVCSTGQIGVPLPMEAIRRGVPEAVRLLGPDGTAAAEAILTTDTGPKAGAVQVMIGQQVVTVGGMSKGAGMIHPQMATTLTVLTTDAAVAPAVLQAVLRRAADQSFNRITVDGDRSTNDTILVLANGEAGAPEVTGPGEALDALQAALNAVTVRLAKAVAQDGEGATKLVEITVEGAQTDEDAERAAFAVANSPLVKTAIHGAGANWGRIMAAVGYSGAEVQPDRVTVRIGPVVVAERGTLAGGPERLEQAGEHLMGQDVRVGVDLGLGRGIATVWTCDLSEEYVKE
ncbi:MAG TPA: bifunctional glutamate N-acetyltransferase/amino-acid acetyltransferase ArgJ, partial [bacterium]|nr:bifunctional glutamate N-acetyltransferase/amino-acid acetyltransferase ArgJ [bacterium]